MLEFLQGGSWIGKARDWIQRHKQNGERVTWGSADVLQPPMTVKEVEDLAAGAAWVAYQQGYKDAQRELAKEPLEP